MNFDVYSLGQSISFILVHYTTIWLLAVFFGTALASWRLAAVLDQKSDRGREAQFARKTAIVYAIVGGVLWAYSFIMS